MKTNKFYIVVVCLLFAGQIAFAQQSSIQHKVENWTTERPEIQKAAMDLSEGPTADPTVPVSDSLPVLCLLAGAYAAFTLVRRKKELVK
jgi:hypothetical protein